MVGTDSIADIGFLLEFLGYLGAIEGVGKLTLLIGHLADIVEQSGTLCFLRIQSQFRCHDSTEIGRLTGMLQQVLTITGTVFHLSYDTNQFGVQAVDAEIDGCTLSRLDDLVLKLFLHLCHDLFDTCGMDATIRHQLMECQTAHLTTYGVKGADDDGFGRIVDDDLNAGSCLQCTNVTSFASDDTSFHLVVVDMEHADRVFDGCFSSHTLDGLDDDLLRLRIGVELGLVHDLIDIAGSIRAGFVLQALHQTVTSLLGAQATQFLKLLTLFELHLGQFILLHSQHLLLVIDALLSLIHLLLLASQLFLTLVEIDLTLLQPVFVLLNLLVALLHFLLQLCFLVQEFLLHLKQFLLFQNFCLFLGSVDHLFILPSHDMTEEIISTAGTDSQCHHRCNDNWYNHLTIYYIVSMFVFPSQALFDFAGETLENTVILRRIVITLLFLVA